MAMKNDVILIKMPERIYIVPFHSVTLRYVAFRMFFENLHIYTYFPCITFMTGPIRIESYGRYNKFRGYQRHPTIFMTITVAKVPCVCRE